MGGPIDGIKSFVGIWVWCCILRRGALSILEKLFDIPAPTGGRARNFYRLSPKNYHEYDTLLDIAPVLFADLRLSVSPRCYARDASPSGGGVVYHDFHAAQLKQALRILL